jgi:anti-anti-sigma regulatory factor
LTNFRLCPSHNTSKEEKLAVAARKNDRLVVRLDGSLTLNRARDLHGALQEALGSGHPVVVDCADAAEVDVTFLQLLLAARRGADALGRSLSLGQPASGALRLALRRCGLDPAADPRDIAFFGLEQGIAP